VLPPPSRAHTLGRRIACGDSRLLDVGISPAREGSRQNLRKRLRTHLRANASGSTLRFDVWGFCWRRHRHPRHPPRRGGSGREPLRGGRPRAAGVPGVRLGRRHRARDQARGGGARPRNAARRHGRTAATVGRWGGDQSGGVAEARAAEGRCRLTLHPSWAPDSPSNCPPSDNPRRHGEADRRWRPPVSYCGTTASCARERSGFVGGFARPSLATREGWTGTFRRGRILEPQEFAGLKERIEGERRAASPLWAREREQARCA
jgi:hypothetical protein